MSKELRRIGDLDISNNPRAAQADLTNAPELFGDPYGDLYGDAEEGDFEDGDFEDGDIDPYGDINNDVVSAYKLTSGDVEEGDTRTGRFLRRYRSPLLMAGGAGAAYYGGRKLVKYIRQRRAQRSLVSSAMSQQRSRQTLRMQELARSYAGKISRNKLMPFFQLIGAKMNSSPIEPTSKFVADMFKYNLDRQNADTPFLQETAIGVFAAGVWTCTATGVVAARFYTGLILQVGINALNAAPGTIFQCTATLPTFAGPLVVAANPWIFTIQHKFDVRFLFFPWQLVSNKPLPVLGSYNNANPIIVVVTGLPAASAVNLVVPGSLHPWTIAMRNALI